MAALRRQVKELPPLVNEQVNEFPAQINEIEHGYRQLTTAHYVFTDDIPGMVEDVNEKMADANTALKSLDVDATEAANSASMLLRQTCANLLITPCVKIASCRQNWII